MRKQGANANTNDESTVSDFVKITVNTAVVAEVANPLRMYWAVTITDKDAFIRFIPAATDGGTRKGIFLKKDQTYEMPACAVRVLIFDCSSWTTTPQIDPRRSRILALAR